LPALITLLTFLTLPALITLLTFLTLPTLLLLLGMPGYKATEAIAKDLEAKGFTVRIH
jgi:energy-converting hydrogenase Eha subunit B